MDLTSVASIRTTLNLWISSSSPVLSQLIFGTPLYLTHSHPSIGWVRPPRRYGQIGGHLYHHPKLGTSHYSLVGKYGQPGTTLSFRTPPPNGHPSQLELQSTTVHYPRTRPPLHPELSSSSPLITHNPGHILINQHKKQDVEVGLLYIFQIHISIIFKWELEMA